MKRIVFVIVAALTFVACLPYGSTDQAWTDLPVTTWSLGPRCTTEVEVYYHDGDFNAEQIQDITNAFVEIQAWSHIPSRLMNATWWRWENAPWNTITIEARTPPAGSAYGNITLASDKYYGKGTVQLGSSIMTLPTGRSGYNTGNTFRGRMEHELIHAFVGLGDLYNKDDGHPTLLMGNGYDDHSQAALGDLIGMVRKGCRTQANKDATVAQLIAGAIG